MKKLFWVIAALVTAMALVSTGCKKEPVQLKVEIFDRGTDGGRSLAQQNAWTDWVTAKVKEDLNIDVVFVPVGRWSENTDIVNLMASGDAPDLCYTYNGAMISSFRDQGGVMNLAPFIDQYLPDLKKLLGDDPAFPGTPFIYRNTQPADGHIYSIPSYRVALAQRNIFIRKDWLDKLGLGLPKTTQEFYNALIAFRDQDPGNVGKNRVVPFGQNSDARWGLASLIEPSIDPNMSDRDRWVYNIADRNIMMPGYKEGVRMMNKWYNEGLIYRDFPLMTTAEDFYNQMKSGVVGAFAQNWDMPYRTDYKIAEDLAKNVPGAEFVPIDPIQSTDGITHKAIMDKVGLQMFIPSFSKNHIAALQYLNWLAKYDNYHFLQVGEEGRNHIVVNGVPQTISTPAGDPWFMNSANNIDMTMPMNGVEMGSTELNARVLALGYGNTPAEVIVNAYNIATTNGRAASVYQTPTSKDGIYGQTLQDKADALLAQAVMAAPSAFDRVWDAGMTDWLASGGQEVWDERDSLYK